MPSLNTIKMNYRQGMAQADKLEELANMLKEESDSKLEDTIANLNVNWTGDNAQAFMVKIRNLQGKIRKNSEQVRKASETVRKIVQNTYEAEMRNYRIASKRTYH